MARLLISRAISGNRIGLNCYNISISGEHNVIGDNSCDIIAAEGFSDNKFGNGCGDNQFGNDCWNNSFGNSCRRNSFGNDCWDNSFGNNVNYVTVHNGVQYVSVAGSVGLSDSVNYAQILNGTHGSYGNLLQIPFQTMVSYTQFAALTSNGELRIWNPADLVPTT